MIQYKGSEVIKEAIIIDGKKIADKILADLKAKIDKDRIDGSTPAKLAIILVGNDPASSIYVQNKIKAAAKVGIETTLQKFDDDITENELLKRIERLNQDEEASGIIVQLPLPKNISKAKVVKSIDPSKLNMYNLTGKRGLYGLFPTQFKRCKNIRDNPEVKYYFEYKKIQ